MFNVNQLYSIPQFRKFTIMNKQLLPWRQKREILNSWQNLNIGKKLLVCNTIQHLIQNLIFMHSYRTQRFYIYATIRICKEMLLSYISISSKVQKIYFRERKTYRKAQIYDLFCPVHKCLQGENSFFHARKLKYNLT